MLIRSRGCLRPAHIGPIWSRKNWPARSLTIRNIARWSLIMLVSASSAPVRFLMRGCDRGTYRSKEIPEGPCACHITRTDQHGDQQPDYDCAERSFHWDCFGSAGCPARVVIRETALKAFHTASALIKRDLHIRSSRELTINETPVITVIGKAFVGHAPKD